MRKIVWFEYHFSREHSCEKQSYEDLLKLKWDKYSNLQSFKNLKGVLEDVTKKHVKHRILRREATKQSESAQIFGAYNHRYDVIDSELTALIQVSIRKNFVASLFSKKIMENMKVKLLQSLKCRLMLAKRYMAT